MRDGKRPGHIQTLVLVVQTILPCVCRGGRVCNQHTHRVDSQGEFLSLATKKFLTKVVISPWITTWHGGHQQPSYSASYSSPLNWAAKVRF